MREENIRGHFERRAKYLGTKWKVILKFDIRESGGVVVMSTFLWPG